MHLQPTGAGNTTVSAATNTKSDPTHLNFPFPFQLIKSDTTPPAPTRPESAIDWLPDYLGHAWIAYAASSLLVISHFPSPSETDETCADPVFRQVIEVSSDGSGYLSAVAWSPAEMCCGELAASLDNCIGVFSHSSEGSFCWSQTAILVQDTNIEAIKWTGSGDGLISVGINLILWKKNELSWETHWKFKPECPQSLISTTTSILGPFATAPLNKHSTSVLICDGKSKSIKTELHHHIPVSMIQWRPLVANQWKEKPKHPLKLVLLTCCDDGTVRLWSEIDDGRARKTGRLNGSTFRVSATIEINQTVNGILGSNVFVRWATELDGIVNIGNDNSQYFPSEEYLVGKPGKCDWLICFGPQTLITFWAVHCIDDISPLRFPRVTLWKKRELPGSKTETSFPLHKSVISRNGFFGPPDVSSVIRLLPCNHLTWSQFYKRASSEDSLSSIAKRSLNINGHSGKILQIESHPRVSYPGLAVSLDINGVILFWSFSNSGTGLPLNSGCKLIGEFVSHDRGCIYTNLKWAPLIKDDHRFLLMGHAGGIDCFSVKVSQSEDSVSCNNLFTIPFASNCDESGPASIWLTPLTSDCNTFMVLAVWKDHFQALSWKITIRDSEIGINETVKTATYSFESEIFGEKCCILVDRSSFSFPKPYDRDNVTSFASEMFNDRVPYHLITGCLDGSLKLWRSKNEEWELVGVVFAHVGPVTRVSVTNCGRKIASVYTNDHSTLHIWELVYLGENGSFLLEESIDLDGPVVSLNWLTMGNGQLILGVCLPNEVRVYSMRRCEGQSVTEKSNDKNMWFCLAKSQTGPPIFDFIWGPKATGVIVHGDYFCLFSQWVLPRGDKHMSTCTLPQIYSDSVTHDFDKCYIKMRTEKYFNVKDVGLSSIMEITACVGGSLPAYHPEALLVNIYSGNWKRAQSTLQHLLEHLSSTNADLKRVPQMSLSDYVDGHFSEKSNNKVFTWDSNASLDQFSYSTWDSSGSMNSNSNSNSSKSGLSGLTESLEKLQGVLGITDTEKMQILAVVDLLDEINNLNSASPYGGLDESGRRFWVAVRFQQLYNTRRVGKIPSVGELTVDSALIAWAFHSDCQDSLFDSFLNNNSSWHEMRNLGVGYWYTNNSQLRVKMERLAKQQYLKNKDPKACTLLYIALNRVQVLAGLFKISKDEKDKPLVAFLSRNFQDEKNKAAALKNAYVLMGRHQLELAVAFFLLGGDTSSAVNVCTKTLKDEQLALVISRLVEGYNGPSEHHLISKFLLPSAYENNDYWKSSILEWALGNYSKSFTSMLGEQVNSSNHAAFKDSSVGQYCLMLATKNQMKNAIGEQNTSTLNRWAVLMTSTSLNRCGLPIEALECLSFTGSEQKNIISENSETKIFNERLNPSACSSNWVSADVALHVLSHAKHSFAARYIANLLTTHPSWPQNKISSSQVQYNALLSSFENKLNSGLAFFEQKYSLSRDHLINLIIVSLHNHGLAFIGCRILQHDHFALNGNISYPTLPTLVLNALEDFSFLFSKYNTICMINCCDTNMATKNRYSWLNSCKNYTKDLLFLISNIKSGLKLLDDSDSYAEKFLDLCEYYIYFTSFWFQKDPKSLILVLKPILLTYANKSVSFDSNMKILNDFAPNLCELLDHNETMENDQIGHGNGIPEKDKQQIIRASLWGLMSGFLKYQIGLYPENLEDNHPFRPHDSKNVNLQLATVFLAKLLKSESQRALSYCAKQLASFLLQKVKDESNQSTVLWLENLCRSTSITNYQGLGQCVDFDFDFSRIMDNEDGLYTLWNLFDDHKMLCGDLAVEYSKWSQLIKQKCNKGWNDVYTSITGDHGHEESDGREAVDHSVDFSVEHFVDHKHTPFQKPKEVHKINGELLEALCINSIDQQQAAIACNKKGIIFYNWEDGRSSFEKSNYIWTDVDWPTDGWAGSESTPVPTCVSPGIGLGSRKGTHLGLGGATIGVGLAKPVSTSRLGWEIQQDFEELVDPPATVDNIRTRAFSSHPSRPFFLAGSSNTHVYLWEFGKSTATATYGVLPAANVPPPYALASISAVHFDHCGQRFATAASDGTVCTWQLEVGGRSNVRPTESSLCFNNYTSDVTYVTSSGSIVAAVGYSSNNVNVVIWDTLAPPTTSRASIMCHEGGARSICVFPDEIGSGSVSPLIVTGGKGGDVGVHDFRYIATRRPKKHKNSDNNIEHKFNTSSTAGLHSKHGDQNRNGMLWYIPKAHSGSVTRISAIPDTSFFLTGSKDGDVKLWDAKRAKLVYHWPKMHERHTFIQPSSRGFGGVVRAAVTDIQVVSNGFLSCGGDGSVKLVQLRDLL